MEIILSTRNPSKAQQIRALFSGGPFNILSLEDVGIVGEAVEDGHTLQENALKKAWYVREFCKKADAWAMADDTGLFITALGGAPGIKAASWAGDSATTEEITQHTLHQLQGSEDRTAAFLTVVALVAPSDGQFFFHGAVRGHILEEARVKPQPKMPYSPLFVPDGSNLVWAEMSVEQENAISHRAIAFRKARTFLESVV